MSQLRDEIRQTKEFSSRQQEAFLSLGRTWALLDHELSEMLRQFDITATQYNVLRILRGAGETGLCRADIMDRLVARVPDATRLLDRLEVIGLLEREREEADRRFVTTRITPPGLALLEKLDRPVEQLHQRHFGALTAGEVEGLIGMLGQLRERP